MIFSYRTASTCHHPRSSSDRHHHQHHHHPHHESPQDNHHTCQAHHSRTRVSLYTIAILIALQYVQAIHCEPFISPSSSENDVKSIDFLKIVNEPTNVNKHHIVSGNNLVKRSDSISNQDVNNKLKNDVDDKDIAVNNLNDNDEVKPEQEGTTGDGLIWDQIGELRFVHAFVASISVIIVSELGDKTFFIAAIMAMRQNRWTVFSGAISALVLMTLLSTGLGLATTVIPRSLTHYVSVVLFFLFGAKMLYDGYWMTEDEAKEEYEEVQRSLSKKEATTDLEYNLLGGSTEDPETGVIRSIRAVPFSTKMKRRLMQFFSLVFIETFTMTFVAEWGDRSQIATIILAAREDVFGITLGAIIGHSLCTGLAVLGGRFIATMISVRTVTIVGGVIFILFAISATLIGVD